MRSQNAQSWQNGILGRENSKCKGPVACVGNKKEAYAARAELS